MADEDISPEKLRELADREYDINDFEASISSGTYRTMGMVVIIAT